MDNATMIRRRTSKAPIANGGWNVFFRRPVHCQSSLQLFASRQRRDVRTAWLDAGNMAKQKRICEQLQRQLWRDAPYIPMGRVIKPTAYRHDLADLPSGFPAFYGVRRTEQENRFIQ